MSCHCHVYGLLARKAPVGVLLRRGPLRQVQLIHWDTSRDRFTPGHWFEGRIYEKRSDLSPDGSLMVLFASSFKPVQDDWRRSSWTSVSKPPYLAPLATWFKGDSWNGGGLFFSNRDLKINERATLLEEGPVVPGSPLRVGHLRPPPVGNGSHLERMRLERDGWKLVQELECASSDPPPIPLQWLEGQEPGPEEFLEWYDTTREFGRGYHTRRPRILVKERHGVQLVRTDSLSRFGRTTHHKVLGDAEHLLLEIGKDTWADFDQSGSVVFTRGGKLFRATGSPLSAEELADFTDHQPEDRPTPDAARAW